MHHVRSFASRHRKLTVLLCIVLALAIAGGAWAIWSMTQSTNNFQAQTGNTLTLNFSNPTAGDLSANQQCFPGGSCPLVARVSNPTSTPIQLSSYQPSSVNTFQDAAQLCPTAVSNGLSGPAETTASTPISPAITVPANATNQVIVLPNALTLAATAGAAACQNKNIVQTSGTVTVTFTAGS